jgi:rod shape-determining protein MreD
MRHDNILGLLGALLSLLICILALPLRLPGMTLMDLAPNWLLIWLVTWSLNRPVLIAIATGIALGLLQDGMTMADSLTFAPTHTIGLAIAAGLTALLQKQRYVQEDFISVALIVFAMAVLVETAIAIQLSLFGWSLDQVWLFHQRIALTSAILSSLWSPVLHFPMSRFWRWLDRES